MTLYDVLGVLPSASQAEIKNAWRELVLKHHPDKSKPSAQPTPSSSKIDIHLLTSAYDILRSDTKREAYDRELADSRRRTRPSGSNTSTTPTPPPPPPLARTTLSLADFTPHYESELVASLEGAEEQLDSDDDDPTHYTHPCRCGFEFLVRREDLEEGVDVVGCDGCGDWVGVGYEVVEDEEEEGEDDGDA